MSNQIRRRSMTPRYIMSSISVYCVPFQSAHLAVIDTLMTAYTVETVSLEKLVACVLQYSSHNDEGTDTPYDTEDAMTSWINKVDICMAFNAHTHTHSRTIYSLDQLDTIHLLPFPTTEPN